MASPGAGKARRKRGNRKLGPFAALVLRTVVELPERDRYGLVVAQTVKAKLVEGCDVAQVYVALHRMQKYGYLTSVEENYSKAETRQVRRYRMTAAGVVALKIAYDYYAMVSSEPSAKPAGTGKSKAPRGKRASRK